MIDLIGLTENVSYFQISWASSCATLFEKSVGPLSVSFGNINDVPVTRHAGEYPIPEGNSEG